MPVVAPSAGVPSGGKVEIEFIAGVWTDVTADVDKNPFTIKVGRTSEFSAPSTGTLDGLRLDNHTGKYTPQSQVLVDGTPHPYWPNVLPRKRIRYSNIPGGTRFVGYIKGWPPFVDQDGRAWVMISATDRLDQLARVTLKSPIAQETSASVLAAQWPLTDAAGSTIALEIHGLPRLRLVGAGPAAVFGDNGPGVGEGTGVKFAPASSSSGQYLAAGGLSLDPSGPFSVEAWVNAGFTLPAWATGAGTETILGFESASTSIGGILYLYNGAPSYQDLFGSINGAASIADGGWHHVAATRTATSGPVSLYVDGVYQGASGLSYSDTPITSVTVGESASPFTYSAERFQGNVGYVGFYQRTLSAAEVAAHAAASNGYSGDTTSARVARWLAAGGLTSADWNLDTGIAVVGTYPQDGKDVVAACQDMAVTEGGGSVVYVTGGVARFTNRATRKPGAPVMTLDAEADLDGAVYAPSFDEMTLVNQCTGNRAASSGTLSSQVFTDLVSKAKFGLTTDSGGITSYSLSDLDVLCLAQSRVAGNANPGFRLGQVGIDLVTATTSLYAALAAVAIGSRVRVTNLPVAQGPATRLDVIVEGWTETVGTEVYTVVFDTSPADTPALGVYDDTSYGRYQCYGQTLNAAITSSATTVVIATAGTAPTFTTVAGRYPMNIQVGQEVITLTGVPSGATSPQTFTGCTRAVAGTQAAAQAGGSAVNLFPASTYAL